MFCYELNVNFFNFERFICNSISVSHFSIKLHIDILNWEWVSLSVMVGPQSINKAFNLTLNMGAEQEEQHIQVSPEPGPTSMLQSLSHYPTGLRTLFTQYPIFISITINSPNSTLLYPFIHLYAWNSKFFINKYFECVQEKQYWFQFILHFSDEIILGILFIT